MTVILRVLVSLPTALRAVNFAFSEASFINRYDHYTNAEHSTPEDGLKLAHRM